MRAWVIDDVQVFYNELVTYKEGLTWDWQIMTMIT